MTDENQHWIPKFLIKHFADSDGRVFCLDKRTDEVKKPPPKYAASDIGFNDFRLQGETISYEDKLEKIETAVAPIVKDIIHNRSLAGLNETQRGKLADFIAAQSFRTQAFHQGLDPTIPREEFGQIFGSMWQGATHLSKEILCRKWALMLIEHDEVFYLGDHPVILKHMEEAQEHGEVGFDIEGVEAYMPLSPTCALWMPCTVKTKEIIEGYQFAQKNINDTATRKIEYEAAGLSGLVALSERIIKNSTSIYRALMSGSGFTAIPEFIENLNWQQCMWASDAIYSNRGDFTFARRVFRENPQYRSIPKVRLETIFPHRKS